MLTLYQTEWCPFSSAVREVLTELGIDYVAKQVEPWPKDRNDLRALAGTDQIPVMQTEDGTLYRGTQAIFAYLREQEPSRFEKAHRRRFEAHRDARESNATGEMLERFRGDGGLESADGPTEEAEVVDVPEASRYELRLGGHLVGLAAYRKQDGRIAFTHTEVDEACQGRGLGSRLAEAVVADAKDQGLEIVPLCPFIAQFV